MGRKKITPAMMGQALGVDPQTIRMCIRAGACDWGTCFKQTGKIYTYVIYPEKAKEVVPRKFAEEWGLV